MMIEHIQRTYQNINAKSLDDGILQQLYTEDAVFIDPFHRIEGRDRLDAYFKQLYRNVRAINFTYGRAVQQDNRITMEWEMRVEHPRLKGGEPVNVSGITCFELEGERVKLHRDYFDAGEMLYENLPVLGRIIRTIKNRMGQ
ncbi:nuclear transport factor 2 family protein [Salinispirillum marinum]|uniref:Nuclear transport factor 2 family protein n=2 Tax=Saccharospirillaceae TaxID=255527 RepID=A0ABV8BH93_9GAMM